MLNENNLGSSSVKEYPHLTQENLDEKVISPQEGESSIGEIITNPVDRLSAVSNDSDNLEVISDLTLSLSTTISILW